jgi:outer membrane biosynthesis protein TonB
VVDGGDPAVSSELDLELETAQLPDDATAPDPVVAATDEDSAPLEVEPAVDTREPVVEVADDAPSPPAETVDPVPPEQSAVATPPAEPGAPRATEKSGITAQAKQPRKTPKVEARQERRPDRSTAEPAPAAAPVQTTESAPAPPAPVAEPAPSSTVRVVALSSGSRAVPGDRFHVVRPGESLWSIAADLLGDRATVARVAREVNRLWALNDDRIRTGNPDLLYAGTRLIVR